MLGGVSPSEKDARGSSLAGIVFVNKQTSHAKFIRSIVAFKQKLLS